MAEAIPLILVNGKEITTNDVLINLKTTGKYKDTINELMKLYALRDYASNNKLEVTDDELQDYVTQKRKDMNLFSMPELNAYLGQLGITSDQWIDSLEDELLTKKVKDNVFNDQHIENYYKENQAKYTIIYLFKIEVDTKDLAEELLLEAKDDHKDFTQLAKKYSIDKDTAEIGGFYGKVKRGELPTKLETKIFAANKGEFVGPFENDGKYDIFFIENSITQSLNNELKKEIKEAMFKMWQSQLVQTTHIESPKPKQ